MYPSLVAHTDGSIGVDGDSSGAGVETAAAGTLGFVGLLAALALIVVAVILGNSLVIVAVLTYPKLRSSVNNSFIASLAAADFLLGVVVLPFSATSEAMGEWIFGDAMCNAWLAIDVWMSTASIYHLCVISFDRYLAVNFPLKYPNIMSHFRCRVLIAVVWIVSFLICFPPLVGWQSSSDVARGVSAAAATEATSAQPLPSVLPLLTSAESNLLTPVDGTLAANLTTPLFAYAIVTDVSSGGGATTVTAMTNSSSSRSSGGSHRSTVTCEVVGANSPGYVIYSSLGSFYVPMVIMVFFYVKVFNAAKRFNEALRTGIIDTRTTAADVPCGAGGACGAGTSSALRVHRGPGIQRQESAQSMNSLTVPVPQQQQQTPPPLSPTPLPQQQLAQPSQSHSKRTRYAHSRGKLATGSFEACSFGCRGGSDRVDGRPTRSESDVAILGSVSSAASDHSVRSAMAAASDMATAAAAAAIAAASADGNSLHYHIGGSGATVTSLLRAAAPQVAAAAAGPAAIKKTLGHQSSPLTFAERKNLRMAFRILNREAKAAKTLAIIVGAFIVCWLPFFASYLSSAFCTSKACIPEAMFDVFFWIGYFNSALNPIIYAMFSKDYCHAFKKLLRCQLKARKERQKGIINFLTSLYIQGSSSERESLYMTDTTFRSSDNGRDHSNGHLAAS